MTSSKNVAVIGAGASGLVAARELKREGHAVVVFERGTHLGGTWVYTPEVESDPLGLDPARKVVHSSLYASLRTNLPREVMGFRDFPFVPSGKAGRDSRRFPNHQEVLRYLEDFANEFGLDELIRYQTEVRHVGLDKDGKWTVKFRHRSNRKDEHIEVDETYDAVVVCNGHYSEPRIADSIPGVDLWPGKQIHSHNYRVPEPYKNQVVILIGSSASAMDICRELAGVAKEVHIAIRSEAALGRFQNHPVYDKILLHPMIERTHEDGRVSFLDGKVIHADVILHCTGYKYDFPFLEFGAVSVDDGRVGPLYKHVFPPTLAPGISFIGVPFFVTPFFLYELQSKWVAGVLSGRLSIPSVEKMTKDIEAFYSELDTKGVPKRFTHKIHDFQRLFAPFEYEDWLAEISGCSRAEEWRKNMFFVTGIRLMKQTETYRDKWDDEDLILQAYQDFEQYLSADGRTFVATSAM